MMVINKNTNHVHDLDERESKDDFHAMAGVDDWPDVAVVVMQQFGQQSLLVGQVLQLVCGG